MNVEIFIALLIGTILLVDAIKYRIILFKLKKLGVSIEDITENIPNPDDKVSSLKVHAVSSEEALKKTNYFIKILDIINDFEVEELGYLLEDLDFLKYSYEINHKELVKTFEDVLKEGEDGGYNE